MRLFTEHPASVGESYVEHFGMASGFGFRMILGGLACLVHGILPFLFTKTGSRIITVARQLLCQCSPIEMSVTRKLEQRR